MSQNENVLHHLGRVGAIRFDVLFLDADRDLSVSVGNMLIMNRPFRILCPNCGTEAMVDPRRPRELACPERTCQAATTDGVWDYGYGGEQTIERAAYSVAEFLERNRIGRNLFYEEVNSGNLEIMKVGSRTLISAEAERLWHQRSARVSTRVSNGASDKRRQTQKNRKP